MEIKVPLSHFTDYLREVKEKASKWPHLDEAGWLIENFKFDDEIAEYHPPPPYTEWWRDLARN